MRGNAPEASTISHSTTCITDAKNINELVMGKSSPADSIFPLVEDMLRDCNLPRIVYMIIAIYVTLQVLATSFWPGLENMEFDDSKVADGIRMFFEIAFMASTKKSDEAILSTFISLCILVFITIMVLITQILIFAIRRQFIKWTLYPSKLLLELISILLLLPTANYIGKLFCIVVKNPTLTHVIFFGISILILAYLLFLFYIQSFFFSSAPFISPSVMACWKGGYQYFIYSGLIFLLIIQYVVQIFGEWIDFLVIIMKIFFDVYVAYMCFTFPFVNKKYNIFTAVLYSSCAILDIINVIISIGIDIPYMYQLIILACSLIISTSVYAPVLNKYYKKIEKNLRYKNLSKIEIETVEHSEKPKTNKKAIISLSDATTREWFYFLKLNNSETKCETYMRIGLAERSDLFLNWSLFKFAAEAYLDSTPMYCLITQMLCFFPSESRLLKFLFMNTCQRPSLKYYERFLIFSVHRVMDLRQNSASNEITTKLIELKHYAQKGINATRDFWSQIPNSPDIFYQINKYCNQGRVFFEEALLKWPNNSRFVEDYTQFLVECGTDFVGGVMMKNRADLIEQGKNYAVDYSFKSMVRVFPYYLKRNVIDIRGNFISKETGTKSRSSSVTGGSSISTGTIDGAMDVELEEEIAHSLFSFHRLRMAFQRALESKKSKNSLALKLSVLFNSLFLIMLCIFFLIYFSDLFTERHENVISQRNLIEIRYGLDTAIASLFVYWARGINAIDDALFEQMHYTGIMTNGYNIRLSENMIEDITYWIDYGRTELSNYIQKMVEFSEGGDNIMQFSEAMFSPKTGFLFCMDDTHYNEPIQSSLKNIFTFCFLRLREISMSTNGSVPNATALEKSDNLCEIMANLKSMFENFDALVLSLAQRQIIIKDETTRSNYVILVICSIVYACTTAPLLIFFLIRYYKELKQLLHTMQGIDADSQKEATKPFKEDKQALDQTESVGDVISQGSINPGLIFSIIICSLVVGVVMLIAIVFLTEAQNNSLVNLNRWLRTGLSRGEHIMEVLYNTMLLLMMANGQVNTNFTTIEKTKAQIKDVIDTLTAENAQLLHGKGGTDPCIGVIERFDLINIKEYCEPGINLTQGTMHDTYACAPIDKAISFFEQLALDMYRTPGDFKLEADSNFFHLFHVANIHLVGPCFESGELLTDNAAIQIAAFRINLQIISIFGIVYALLSIAACIVLVERFDIAYQGALQLLRRLPPLSCVSNPEIMEYLMNKKSERANNKMTTAQSVIMMSRDAVLCLNRNESIDVINMSVTSMFGYTPEQLLGQTVNCLLPEEENEAIYHNFNLMRQGQCSLTYQAAGVGMSDDDQMIPVHITILGISDENSSEASSFAVIIRDETLLHKHRKDAEEAKQQSERLLYQILPRDIVTRLNQGETDISFSVPSASIIFIDIVKWSDYSATLSPSQIMANLSLIFAKFDQALSKYPLITKIKLIGDVYMAAAGLFTPDENPANHAMMMVQFALDCLLSVDDANTALDSSLQVRIGINTDGPLIAGVLGTDKPVFDIIGDPINVASRLQSTCIPSTVQISHSTYSLVAEMNFNIEKRGEIELKGKGKKLAYLVKPIQTSSFYNSISDREMLLI